MLSITLRSTMDERIAYNAAVKSVHEYYGCKIILPLLTFESFQRYLDMDEEKFADYVVYETINSIFGQNDVSLYRKLWVNSNGIVLRFDSDDDDVVLDCDYSGLPYPEFKRQSIDLPNLHPGLKNWLVQRVIDATSDLTENQPGYDQSASDNIDWIMGVIGYDLTFELLNAEMDSIVDSIRLINLILFENFNNLLSLIGKTASELAEDLRAPVRTVNGWCTSSDCKPYIRLLIAEKYGLI